MDLHEHQVPFEHKAARHSIALMNYVKGVAKEVTFGRDWIRKLGNQIYGLDKFDDIFKNEKAFTLILNLTNKELNDF